MKRKTLMPLLFVLVALPAAAQDFGSVFGQPLPLVAQMSQEERRALRERWEHASPDERIQLRKAFQERLRMPSPEQLDPRRTDFRRGSSRDSSEMGSSFMPGNGFGTGYEQRRYDGRYPFEDDPTSSGYGNGSGGNSGGERRGGGRR